MSAASGYVPVQRHQAVASSSVAACRLTARLSCSGSRAKRSIAGTTPAVRHEMARAASRSRGIVEQTAGTQRLLVVVERLAHAHEHDVGDAPVFGTQAAREVQHLVDHLLGVRSRRKPRRPEAQKAQRTAQPTWVETQTVARRGYVMSTASTGRPSRARKSVFSTSPRDARRASPAAAQWAAAGRPARRATPSGESSSRRIPAPDRASAPGRPVVRGTRAHPARASSAGVSVVDHGSDCTAQSSAARFSQGLGSPARTKRDRDVGPTQGGAHRRHERALLGIAGMSTPEIIGIAVAVVVLLILVIVLVATRRSRAGGEEPTEDGIPAPARVSFLDEAPTRRSRAPRSPRRSGRRRAGCHHRRPQRRAPPRLGSHRRGGPSHRSH